MAIKIRMRGKVKGSVAEVKALIKHKMEPGTRMNKKTGKPYPAEYINEVNVAVNGKTVTDGQWSGAVSTNPYLKLLVSAKFGDKVTLSLKDNTGKSGKKTLKLK